MELLNVKKVSWNNIKNNVICGIIMTDCAILISYLGSERAQNIAFGILIISIVVAGIYFLSLNMIKHKGKKVKISVSILLAVVSGIMFGGASIYTLAPTQLFYPHFDKESYDKLQKYEQVEELKIQKESYELGGWFLHNGSGKAPLVIYYGGNGENASTRMLTILEKENLQELFSEYNIAIIDYPGYGKSKGTPPSESSLKEMGIAAFEALSEREDVDADNIVLMGYSIGTGVANYVASERNSRGLLLIAPYADGYDLYNQFAGVFYGPMRLLVAFPMESVQFAEQITVQPVLLASKSDEMVRYESSVRLSKAYQCGVRFETIEGIKHNEFWGSNIVQQYIKEYLEEVHSNAK